MSLRLNMSARACCRRNTLLQLALVMIVPKSHDTAYRNRRKYRSTLYVKTAGVLDLEGSLS